MKYTLLEIVQSILSDMDSEDANSISDHIEAQQVASIVRDTYYNLVSTRVIPEHKELVKLIPLSDSEFPTHFKYPEGVSSIELVSYENSDGRYQTVPWMDPLDFLTRTDERDGEDYITVKDKTAGTNLRIRNDHQPEYYTSFDDEHVVMNSYDSSVDTTLQASKVRAYGKRIPAFQMSDDFTPDIDADIFPLLLNESKSAAMSILKGGSDPKVEQAARRQRVYIQNERYNTKREPKRAKYGRK